MEIKYFCILMKEIFIVSCSLSTYNEENGCNLEELTERLQCEHLNCFLCR